MLVESSFEYGSRRGVWRLLRLFEERKIKIGILAVATALARNREVAAAMVEAGHEIVSHHYRWIDYQHVPIAVERRHVRLAVETLTELAGERPVGWMTGRPSPNTRRLLVEEGGFLYDRDALNDELPYWVEVAGRQHLVIPYSYETNDNRFDGSLAFATAEDFFNYMKDTLRHALQRGRERAAHDVARPARPVDRTPRPRAGARTVPRLCAEARPRVDLPRRRYRAPLDGAPSGTDCLEHIQFRRKLNVL